MHGLPISADPGNLGLLASFPSRTSHSSAGYCYGVWSHRPLTIHRLLATYPSLQEATQVRLDTVRWRPTNCDRTPNGKESSSPAPLDPVSLALVGGLV